MARYHHNDAPVSGHLALLPAAFNPPTTAHLALAERAIDSFGLAQAVMVLPERMPHKENLGASLDDRLAMLDAVAEENSRLGVAVAAGGLILEIVREFRLFVQADVRISVLCGADAADRFLTWAYGHELPPFRQQLDEFELIVATRQHAFEAPADCAHRIHPLVLPEEYGEVSATQVRETIARGEPWRQWVPPRVADYIEEKGLYRV